MPPLPSVTNVLKIRFIGHNNGAVWNNIVHLQYTGAAGGVTEYNAVAAAAHAAYTSNLLPLCNPVVSLDQVDVVDLTSALAASGEHVASTVGTLAGIALPVQVAMVVSQIINMRYRGGHPRFYVPAGIDTSILGGKQWAATFLASARSASAAFLTALNAITFGTSTNRAVSVSYFSNHVLRPTPMPLTVQAMTVHGRVDTQRRRLGKEAG